MASQLATSNQAQAGPRFPTYSQIFNSGDPREATVVAMSRLLMVLGKPPDIPRAEAFSEALSDLGATDLIRAFRRAELECEIVPSIKRLRDFATDSEQEILAEWAYIHAYIKRWGARIFWNFGVQESPTIEPRMQHILEHIGGSITGGLERIDQTQPEHKGLLRQDFERAFKSFVPQQE